MHQSFEFLEDQHISSRRIIDDVMDDLPAMQKAADRMARKLHEGKVIFAGDVFVDVPSYKVSHHHPYPFDMDDFKSMHTLKYPVDYCINTVDSREIVEPFDFDKYNGIKR